MTEPLRITLQPDWGTGPLWVSQADGVSEPYDSEEIADVVELGDELRDAIAAWDERFQATFNAEYPPDSAFPTPEEEAAWLADGKRLALRLREELPGAEITYSTIDGKIISLDDAGRLYD